MGTGFISFIFQTSSLKLVLLVEKGLKVVLNKMFPRFLFTDLLYNNILPFLGLTHQTVQR